MKPKDERRAAREERARRRQERREEFQRREDERRYREQWEEHQREWEKWRRGSWYYQQSLSLRDLPGFVRQAQGLPFTHDETLFHD